MRPRTQGHDSGDLGHADLTAHGFRSTFAEWVTEQTTFPNEVREMALAHNVGTAVEAAYRRIDLLERRRQLAEAWARFCAGEDTAGEDVVPRERPSLSGERRPTTARMRRVRA